MAKRGGQQQFEQPLPQQFIQQPLPQQSFQQPFGQQPLPQQVEHPLQQPFEQQPFEQQPLQQPLQQQFEQQPFGQQPLQQQFEQPLSQPFGQQSMQQPLSQPFGQQSFEQEQPAISYPNEDYLYHNITSQDVHNNIKVYVCAFSIEQAYIKYYMQKQTNIELPHFMFTYQEPALYQGGYQDSAESGDPLDAAFIQKCQEFITNSTFVGYIPNISEPGSVFAFLKVVTAPANLIPCVSNELFYLSKVGPTAVSPTILNMFSNNKWLVSASDPFSGYACKLDNTGTNLINIAQGETPDLVDIDSVGSYYYFSFLPLNDTGAPLDRYVLFPQEYTCVKTLEPEFENESDSIYLDGALISDKQLFALTLPTQFAKIE